MGLYIYALLCFILPNTVWIVCHHKKIKCRAHVIRHIIWCYIFMFYCFLAVYDAVVNSTPNISRVMTLTGDAMAVPQNFLVPYGVSHAQVLEEAGGLSCEAEKLISGGPMMGMAMYDLNTPVTKTSSSILAMSRDEVAASTPTNCIRCGRCADACPSHLVPQMMAAAVERDDLDYFQKIHGMECYECGS